MANKLVDTVCGKTWMFGRSDGTTISREVTFWPQSVVEPFISINELGWRIYDGVLEFVDTYGKPTTRFTKVGQTADGKFELQGEFIENPLVVHVLREVFDRRIRNSADPTGRRNLVVMRAGNAALVSSWKPEQFRTWDLAILFYGSGTPDWGQEYFVAEKGPKWQPIYRWIKSNYHLLFQYDYIWFPDDDIMTSWENVNGIFGICRDYRLQLAQPALTADSYILHAVTRENPKYLLRYTSFVETMVPVFSAEALRVCLPVLEEESRFGWGHDWVLPMLLGYPQSAIAIIDGAAVTHTRPAGANTDHRVAVDQMHALLAKYGARYMDHRVRGCVFREPQAVEFVAL